MKRQRVDPFIPVHKPLAANHTSPKPTKLVGQDIVAPRARRRPALDHLRPWRNVQRPQSLLTKVTEPPRNVKKKTTTSPPPKPSQPPVPQAQPTTIQPVAAPKPVPQAIEQPYAPTIEQASEAPVRRRRWAYPLQLLLGSIAILAIGALAQIVYVGEAAIALYGLYALIKHITSRTTFLLALVSFGCIILMLFIRPDPILMKNFATYAFLFLFIAVASLLREARE